MPQKRSQVEPCSFERENLILRFQERIPSTQEAVDGVISRIMCIAEEMKCAEGELEKVELALKEALTNAVIHGHKEDPAKKVWVSCLCDEKRGMLLAVRDTGPGFDHKNLPDPTMAENLYFTHGRGVFLMRELMDEVQFQKGGREVVMKKNPKA